MYNTIRAYTRLTTFCVAAVIVCQGCTSNTSDRQVVSPNATITMLVTPTVEPTTNQTSQPSSAPTEIEQSNQSFNPTTDAGEIIDPTMPPPFVDMATATPFYSKDATISEQTYQFFRQWLVDSPCATPCWQDITPMQTEGLSAVQSLAKLDEFKGFTVETRTVQTRKTTYPDELDNRANLLLLSPSRKTYVRLLMHNRFLTSTVQSLSISIPGGVTLGEVIKSFGEPTYITVENQDNVSLVFMEHGVGLTLAEGLPAFTNETRFYRAYFFDPSDTKLSEVSERWIKDELLKPWEGVKPLKDYFTQ